MSEKLSRECSREVSNAAKDDEQIEIIWILTIEHDEYTICESISMVPNFVP